MQFNVIFTEEADDTFDLIGNQILERWGEVELFKFRARVYDIVERLSKFPFIFQEVESSVDIRKAVIHKNCSLFYKVSDGDITLYSFGITGKTQYLFKRTIRLFGWSFFV